MFVITAVLLANVLSSKSTKIYVGQVGSKDQHVWVLDSWQFITNLTRNHEAAGPIPGFAQWVNDPVWP